MSVQPYLGTIEWVAFDYAPRGWAKCDGQLLSVGQHSALFALLGNMYGGDGVATFALPDLRGRTPIGWAPGGQAPHQLATQVGAESHQLGPSELPAHTHTVGVSDHRAESSTPGPGAPTLAGGSRAFVDRESATEPPEYMGATAISEAGGGLPHDNMQPYLTLNAIIALEGIFPSRW